MSPIEIINLGTVGCMDFRTLKIKLVGIFSLFILTTGCPQMQMRPQIQMPGESYSEEFKELNKEERAILQSLKKHIGFLAGTLGERNMFVPKNLESAAAYIDKSFHAQGYKVSSHGYPLQKDISLNITITSSTSISFILLIKLALFIWPTLLLHHCTLNKCCFEWEFG